MSEADFLAKAIKRTKNSELIKHVMIAPISNGSTNIEIPKERTTEMENAAKLEVAT